jgi:plasmid maintenance system antidote protein VapI
MDPCFNVRPPTMWMADFVFGPRPQAEGGRVPFEPDWAMPPGAILRAELSARSVSEERFTELSELDVQTVHGILAGTVRVDQAVAAAVADVLGTTRAMWLNLQANYDAALARGAKDISCDYGEDQEMGEMNAAARAAGYEVEARCSIGHGADALLELPGEQEAVRVSLAEVAEALGVAPRDVPGMRMMVTVRESVESGRVLSGFRPAG